MADDTTNNDTEPEADEDRTNEGEGARDRDEPTEQPAAEPGPADAEQKKLLTALLAIGAQAKAATAQARKTNEKVEKMVQRLELIEGGLAEGQQQGGVLPTPHPGKKAAAIVIMVIVLLIFLALPIILMWRAHKSEARMLEAVDAVGDAVLELGD